MITVIIRIMITAISATIAVILKFIITVIIL